MKALIAYGFSGGLALGVSRHFNLLAAFEDGYAVKTLRHNFPKLPIFSPVANWPIEDTRYRGVDFLAGNPPCAAWSVAGYTKTRGTDKWRTDPRVECTVKHFELMKRFRPTVWAWESVTQAYTKGAEFVRRLEEDAIAEGYAVTYLLHNAQWFGLPQVRKRFFMICHRVAFSPRAPNWAPPPGPLEVLEEVPEELRIPTDIRDNWNISLFTKKVLRTVPPGTRLRSWWEQRNPEKTWKRREDGAVIGRPSYGHYRLHPTEPGGAVVGYGIVHPKEHRFISTKEYQSLSGFPLDYHFTPGSASARASEIARGVCPPVAEWLAREVKAAISAGKPIGSKVTEIDYRQPPTTGDDPSVRPLEPNRAKIYMLGTSMGVRPLSRAKAADATRARTSAKADSRGVPVRSRARRTSLEVPAPLAECKSGAYIRILLKLERWTTAEIVAAVRQHYRTSKATAADVAWHRDELAKIGQRVRVVREMKDGTRKFMERRAAT